MFSFTLIRHYFLNFSIFIPSIFFFILFLPLFFNSLFFLTLYTSLRSFHFLSIIIFFLFFLFLSSSHSCSSFLLHSSLSSFYLFCSYILTSLFLSYSSSLSFSFSFHSYSHAYPFPLYPDPILLSFITPFSLAYSCLSLCCSSFLHFPIFTIFLSSTSSPLFFNPFASSFPYSYFSLCYSSFLSLSHLFYFSLFSSIISP